MINSSFRRSLDELAGLCGIQLGYTANGGQRVEAGVDSLLAALVALGHPVEDFASVRAELELVREVEAARVIEPVLVLTANGTANSGVSLDLAVDRGQVSVTVVTETGQTSSCWLSDLGDDPLDLSGFRLAPGYHRLSLRGPGVEADALVLVRPPALPLPRGQFGLIAPLYAIRGADDWGVGSFTDLAALAGWVADCGGDYAGTLPLFAGNLRAPVDPSPYLPYSRLFWNELFLDIAALPEATAPGSVALIEGPGFRSELDKLAAEPAVDYAAVMDRKRQVLELCVEELLGSEGDRRAEYESYLVRHPDVTAYAEFRAADDQASGRWRSWPASPGRLPPASVDPRSIAYHCYVQFATASQLTAASTAGAGLYLDLPIGVHPDGYDTWAHSDLFVEAGVGAPPDALAPEGQSWGFPPLHPDRLRETGYDYLIRAYRTALSFASAIRIDHVLGLHRLFWIPSGGAARDGVYVRYHQEELRAVIAIEAARAGAVVVGEDLGTVTTSIRQAMDRDGMLHSFVTRFEASATDPLPQPRRPSAASLGSHDLPKFAASWAKEGPLGADDPRAGMASSEALTQSLYSLAEGPANIVFADLGDLVGEIVPDNRPGTGPEAGNWQHRLPRRLDEIAADPAITAVLAGIRDRRTAAAGTRVAATEGETT